MLTICLVVGRKNFLNETLESLEDCLSIEHIRAVVVCNGRDDDLVSELTSFSSKFKDKVEYIELETHQIYPNTLWQLLNSKGIDWVLFPGDDDVLVPQGLAAIVKEITSSADGTLVAVAAKAKVIDDKGSYTGDLRTPMNVTMNQVSNLAHAFNRPPFIWPCLAFRLDSEIIAPPYSRFAIDWWVSLSLLTMGRVKVLDEASLMYRTHQGQESQKASLRRKNYESTLAIKKFVTSANFRRFLNKIGIQGFMDLWSRLCRNLPIYGTLDDAIPILWQLRRVSKELFASVEMEIEVILTGDIAALQGVFVGPSEYQSIMPSGHMVSRPYPNYSLNTTNNSCAKLTSFVQQNFLPNRAVSFQVRCQHGQNPERTLFIDCQESFLEVKEKIDSLTSQVTTLWEKSDQIIARLTPSERFLIGVYRRLRKFISPKAFRLARKKFLAEP